MGHAGSQASSLVSLQQLTQRLDLLQPHAGVPQPPVAAKSPPVGSGGGGSRPGGKSGGSKSRATATSSSLGPPAATAATHLALPPGYGYPGHHPGSVATPGGQGRMVGGGVPGQIARPPNVTINPSIMQAQYNAMQQYNAYNAMLNPALVSLFSYALGSNKFRLSRLIVKQRFLFPFVMAAVSVFSKTLVRYRTFWKIKR